MPCGKNFRRRRDSSDVEEDETTNEVSVTALLVGEKQPHDAEADASDPFLMFGLTRMCNDPFKLKTGGVVDMKKIKDRDMMKYIETELKKKKGLVEAEEQKVKVKNAEDHLYELPESIRVNSAKKTEEMLSNQMLSGIPEVDLGIDAKIKNIIQTEDAKARLLAEQRNKKKDNGTSFVPTNIAVNYVQHNRFYHEDVNAPQRHQRHREEPKARPLRVGDTEKPGPEGKWFKRMWINVSQSPG
ncbi:hypothetical protein FQN60_017811 [Etheostoma spectabile]|uniref:Uncharacterized protein n=1 Tax=Etheostoma spectabile TaxID=54343 RepID=A0A5J5DG67_9PERO|nr:hypothetical protein FQN60_017811 [Etheostoma spectabile]